jgi:hypothetical protein
MGRFLHAGPALHRPRAAPARAPQPLTAETRPSALSLPPIPLLCSTPRGIAGEIAVVEPTTRHHLHTTVLPPVRTCPGTVVSFPHIM